MQRWGESATTVQPLRCPHSAGGRGRRLRGLRRGHREQQPEAAAQAAARVGGEGPRGPVQPGQHVLHELGAAGTQFNREKIPFECFSSKNGLRLYFGSVTYENYSFFWFYEFGFTVVIVMNDLWPVPKSGPWYKGPLAIYLFFISFHLGG